MRSWRSRRTARATVPPTVVPREAARRFSSSCVAVSMRTLVLCMQESIHRCMQPEKALRALHRAVPGTRVHPGRGSEVSEGVPRWWGSCAWPCWSLVRPARRLPNHLRDRRGRPSRHRPPCATSPRRPPIPLTLADPGGSDLGTPLLPSLSAGRRFRGRSILPTPQTAGGPAPLCSAARPHRPAV